MSKNKSINSLPHNACTGCKICGDVCPKTCISFKEDHEGFFYPIVDENSCIECGLCSRTCPAFIQVLSSRADTAYSAYASNVDNRNSGSSGGLFPLLATMLLNKGGVVYGAAFDDNLKLHHSRIEELEGLKPLCKSKYLQSDCEGIYINVKRDLLNGKKVLFAGTPCQCQALKNFLNDKLAEDLLLVDFVCHGVPNQKLFDENIKWNYIRFGTIKNIEFRHKGKKVLHPQTLSMVYERNGIQKNIFRMHYQDPFYFGFQKHITLRPSCYQCSWAKPERCSDITLADFWGIEKVKNNLNSKDGISCVILNTTAVPFKLTHTE